MEKNILIVLHKNRKESAVRMQELLTEYGCIIKTRLGLHDGPPNACSESGMVILELAGDKKEMEALRSKIASIHGIAVEMISLSV